MNFQLIAERIDAKLIPIIAELTSIKNDIKRLNSKVDDMYDMYAEMRRIRWYYVELDRLYQGMQSEIGTMYDRLYQGIQSEIGTMYDRFLKIQRQTLRISKKGK